MVNHYKILNIPTSASARDIKSAFKKLSLKLHPDILTSQNLPASELDSNNTKYLQIKKSYEVLSDPANKSAYDIQMGYTRGSHQKGPSQFARSSNAFHYAHHSTATRNWENLSHFDSKKHFERNERFEQRWRERHVSASDIFGQTLYSRNVENGPRKGIYVNYKNEAGIRSFRSEEESKKIISKWIWGTVGLFAVWYIWSWRFSTVNKEKQIKQTTQPKKRETIINNDYSAKLLKEAGVPIEKAQVAQAQVAQLKSSQEIAITPEDLDPSLVVKVSVDST